MNFDLLLHCARTRLDAERAEQIRGLASRALDWDRLIETAERHGVLPLLCQNLNAVCPGSVPPTVLAELSRRFIASAQSNLFLTGELCRILEHFDRTGLKSMPYKGPALAEALYGNLSLRRFCDLDILVPQEDVPAAWKALVAIGYEPQDALNPAQENFCRRFAHHYGFVHPQKSVLVELHWTVLPRWFSGGFDMNAVWARSRETTLAGRSIMSPCAEDLLLMLCLHGAKEAWSHLGWLCDLNELVQKYSIDWDDVFQTARRSGCGSLLSLGLLLVRNLLSTPLPDAVIAKAGSDPAARKIAGTIQAGLFTVQNWDAQIAAIARLNVQARRHSWDRLLCTLRMALVPGIYDVALIRLPRLLFPLYHLVRPIRLLHKYGLRALSGN